jgi:hypothetical protein
MATTARDGEAALFADVSIFFRAVEKPIVIISVLSF